MPLPCEQLERQRYVTQLLREAIGTAVEQLTGGKRAEEAGVRAGVAAPDPVGEAFRELQTELDQRRQLLQAYEFMVEVRLPVPVCGGTGVGV